ncbi:MAG TPA: protein kinase [Kofleriaceae bacterium]
MGDGASKLAPWSPAGGGDESRAYLQARLLVLSKLMFWSFVVLLTFMAVLYFVAYRDLELPDRHGLAPRYNTYGYLLASCGLAMLVGLWVFLHRARPSLRTLLRIDEFYSIGTGAILGAEGTLAYDMRPSAYVCLVYACLMVLLRAIVVPSTGKRTAVIGAITIFPMTIATVALVYLKDQDIPGPAYVGGGVLLCAMAILLASISSNILYMYRKQVSEAMQLGMYTLGEKIGEGGNGAVYRARHALLRRPTALKVMTMERHDNETLDRFEREVQHMSQLTHPNTVAVYDYGRSHEGVLYYVMEYLDGVDLENLVEQYGAQPAERVVPILIQVCGALAEAHRLGLVHRDIKPANIILSVRGDLPDVAKVVDFGLVKELAAAGGGDTTRGIMGTPSYISPESVTAPDQVGPATDLYALGAVGYFLITGKRVFEGKTPVDICVQHVTAKPVPPSQVVSTPIPPELEATLLACLAKQPSARPAGAAELADLLRAVPLGNAWSEAKAKQWWAEFRARPTPRLPSANAVTRSITIDVGMRTPVVPTQLHPDHR